MKIRKKRGDIRQRTTKRKTVRRRKSADDYIEVGQGEFCVMTFNRHDGSTVVQRFATQEEAEAQHRRNVAEDMPLVGVTEFN